MGLMQRDTTPMTAIILPSAARTATVFSHVLRNPGARGILLILKVTAASGTGGLTLKLSAITPSEITSTTITAIPILLSTTAITATGTYSYMIYPGDVTAPGSGSGAVDQVVAHPLPRLFRVSVAVGDASSYTYSVEAHYLP